MIRHHAIWIGLFLSLSLPLAVDSPSAGTSAPDWAADPTRTNGGEVMFQLTPAGVVKGQFQIKVQVDTHSGDLAMLNLQQAAILRAGGKEFRPLLPVKLAGHHAQGTLAFDLDTLPRTFEVVIVSGGSMADLTFRWP